MARAAGPEKYTRVGQPCSQGRPQLGCHVPPAQQLSRPRALERIRARVRVRVGVRVRVRLRVGVRVWVRVRVMG